MIARSQTLDRHAEALRTAFAECRAHTLSLFEDIDDTLFRTQPDPGFSPIGWHLGHIALTEGLWLLRDSAGLALPYPEYEDYFHVERLAKPLRVGVLGKDAVLAYGEAVRADLFRRLDEAPLDDPIELRRWHFVLQHEAMHDETITFLRTLLGARPEAPGWPPSSRPPGEAMVEVPAGRVLMGSADSVAMDNERVPSNVAVPGFRIDVYPVTQADFSDFMAEGGYRRAEFWSDAGRAWLEASGIEHRPLHWREGCTDHPVSGVSLHEAEAYASWAGKRLPSEAEWERAAAASLDGEDDAPHPWGREVPDGERANFGNGVHGTTSVTAQPGGRSAAGCLDMLGNVWEWTATEFHPYPGFEPWPYRSYSEAWFDGRHRVLKGGSWASPRWLLRRSFRNFYEHDVRQILAGFRCAADA
ncbi:MAG: SUMF1/EgtB/PvdO family nonheme iron enzyme [Proteobacteria bacterium]|nr:SUMF1/EgtB/PvdO family nonheme iron enzyme [Pseudomonadota bacterium]